MSAALQWVVMRGVVLTWTEDDRSGGRGDVWRSSLLCWWSIGETHGCKEVTKIGVITKCVRVDRHVVIWGKRSNHRNTATRNGSTCLFWIEPGCTCFVPGTVTIRRFSGACVAVRGINTGFFSACNLVFLSVWLNEKKKNEPQLKTWWPGPLYWLQVTIS